MGWSSYFPSLDSGLDCSSSVCLSTSSTTVSTTPPTAVDAVETMLAASSNTAAATVAQPADGGLLSDPYDIGEVLLVCVSLMSVSDDYL